MFPNIRGTPRFFDRFLNIFWNVRFFIFFWCFLNSKFLNHIRTLTMDYWHKIWPDDLKHANDSTTRHACVGLLEERGTLSFGIKLRLKGKMARNLTLGSKTAHNQQNNDNFRSWFLNRILRGYFKASGSFRRPTFFLGSPEPSGRSVLHGRNKSADC